MAKKATKKVLKMELSAEQAEILKRRYGSLETFVAYTLEREFEGWEPVALDTPEDIRAEDF